MGRWSVLLCALLGACGPQPTPPPDLAVNCADGIVDGDETGVDCGGSCMPCATGGGCLHASDCVSGLCINNVCAPLPDLSVEDAIDAAVPPDMTVLPDMSVLDGMMAAQDMTTVPPDLTP